MSGGHHPCRRPCPRSMCVRRCVRQRDGRVTECRRYLFDALLCGRADSAPELCAIFLCLCAALQRVRQQLRAKPLRTQRKIAAVPGRASQRAGRGKRRCPLRCVRARALRARALRARQRAAKRQRGRKRHGRPVTLCLGAECKGTGRRPDWPPAPLSILSHLKAAKSAVMRALVAAPVGMCAASVAPRT